MDQFCAGKDETYRRCICSAKIQEIKQQQSLLSQTATSLQDFYDYNIDAIPKTAEEIMAMQNATEGEQSIKQDKSNSALTLNSIKDVLYNVKQNVLDSEDKSNVIGNVQTIWETTDLIHGAAFATSSLRDNSANFASKARKLRFSADISAICFALAKTLSAKLPCKVLQASTVKSFSNC